MFDPLVRQTKRKLDLFNIQVYILFIPEPIVNTNSIIFTHKTCENNNFIVKKKLDFFF